MKKIMIIFGTRPEAIKLAPLIKYLKITTDIELKICVTAQHRGMLDTVLNIFEITPDYDLNIMKNGQTLVEMTIRILEGVDKVLKKEKPDLILVHGDTTTSLISAMGAFYNKIPVVHIEAGLRSKNMYSPYPEEFNRKLISDIAEYHFSPTIENKINLLNEGVSEDKIFVTGNTVIDALKSVVKENFIFENELLRTINYKEKKVVLLTIHRRENWGEPMEEIFYGIKNCALKHINDIVIIFPMHENPIVRECAQKILGNIKNIYLIDPLDYVSFSNLMNKSYLVVTDSGGIQEEAPALGKPVVVLREETERMEGVKAGTVVLCGISKEKIEELLTELLSTKEEYIKMSKAINPYGNGESSKKIGNILVRL